MIGNTTNLIKTGTVKTVTPATTLYVPLQLWFCKNPGLALPLIALQYHEVKINVSFRPFTQCAETSAGVTTPPSLGDTSLYIDYIYLDTDERRQFAQVQHEYLIEQVQFTGDESFSNSSVKSRLALNHPVKELVWVIQPDTNATANRWADYTDGTTAYAGADTLSTAKLQLNGHDRFSVRNARYFNVVQPYQHHTRTPATGIYSYSFCINPEAHQPSGSVNMSRIDNAVLQLTLTTGTAAVKLRVYAVNYNVFNWTQKVNQEIGLLVKILYEIFATLSNCGNLLRAFTTTFIWKHLKGTRLITVPNGNNVNDWTIRNQVSYNCKIKVQRLNVSGQILMNLLKI